jgi:hypothetical protein
LRGGGRERARGERGRGRGKWVDLELGKTSVTATVQGSVLKSSDTVNFVGRRQMKKCREIKDLDQTGSEKRHRIILF